MYIKYKGDWGGEKGGRGAKRKGKRRKWREVLEKKEKGRMKGAWFV